MLSLLKNNNFFKLRAYSLTNMKHLEDLAKSIAREVEKALGIDLKKIEENLLTSNDQAQRNYERFFRELFRIPIPHQGLLELSQTYLEDLMPESIRGILKDDNEVIELTAQYVMAAFKYEFKTGNYYPSHIRVEEASKDISEALSIFKKEKYKEVIKMYYGFTHDEQPQSIQEIAKKLKLSKKQAYAIKNAAMKRIKATKRDELAEKYSTPHQKALLKEQNILTAVDSLTDKLDQAEKQIQKRLNDKAEAGPEKYFNEPISTLKADLPTRTYNSLMKGGINTIGQLIILTERELHRYPEMGNKGIAKISQALKERFGLSLEMTQYKKINSQNNNYRKR
jgi:hypothetical protein